MKYQDQSAANLRLTLVQGRLNTAQFKILAERTVSNPVPGIASVRAGIIGSSHFVTIMTDDGQEITEVFACTEVVVDQSQIAAKYGPLEKIKGSAGLKLPDGLAYEVDINVHKIALDTWSSTDEEIHHLELRCDRPSNPPRDLIALKFLFPAKGGADPAEYQPMTIVLVSVDPNHQKWLRVKTLHLYPNESAAVFTDTLVRKN